MIVKFLTGFFLLNLTLIGYVCKRWYSEGM